MCNGKEDGILVKEGIKGVFLTLDSRRVIFPESSDSEWPLMLHDAKVRKEIEEFLPQMVQALMQPVESATQDQVREIFSLGEMSTKRSWNFNYEKNDSYSFTAIEYDKNYTKYNDMCLNHYRKFEFNFDKNGRMNSYIVTDYDPLSRNQGHRKYTETYEYNDQGYLTERIFTPITWIKDKFSYSKDSSGRIIPVKMTRETGYGDNEIENRPMVVDLANYREWIAKDPNGFSR